MIDFNVQELRKVAALAQPLTISVHAIPHGDTSRKCDWAIRLGFQDGQTGRIVLHRFDTERTFRSFNAMLAFLRDFWPSITTVNVVLSGGQ